LTVPPRHRAFTARITTPAGYDQTVRTRRLTIANGAFPGTRITGDASAADRYLLAYTLGNHARRRLLAATVRHLATGRRPTLNETQLLATDQLRLETDPVLPIDIDGELCAQTPVDIYVDPSALRVMVAENFPGTAATAATYVGGEADVEGSGTGSSTPTAWPVPPIRPLDLTSRSTSIAAPG
jgi:diacylglycerol kinase family enzyme